MYKSPSLAKHYHCTLRHKHAHHNIFTFLSPVFSHLANIPHIWRKLSLCLWEFPYLCLVFSNQATVPSRLCQSYWLFRGICRGGTHFVVVSRGKGEGFCRWREFLMLGRLWEWFLGMFVRIVDSFTTFWSIFDWSDYSFVVRLFHLFSSFKQPPLLLL